MEDMERYGDYNELDEEPGSKSPVGLILKIIIAVLCISVVGVIAFRIVLFNSYPDSMKYLWLDADMSQYYEQTGAITVKTQQLRAPYDDPDEGNFFCDYLYVSEELGKLQITARFNVSVKDSIIERYKLKSIDIEDPDIFEFRLKDDYGRVYECPSNVATDELLMYRYRRLTFSSVVFDGDEAPNWIRLEVYVKGVDSAAPFAMVAIYENNDNYSLFEEYTPTEKEILR